MMVDDGIQGVHSVRRRNGVAGRVKFTHGVNQDPNDDDDDERLAR